MKFMIACAASLLCVANAANAVDMLSPTFSPARSHQRGRLKPAPFRYAVWNCAA